MSYYIVNLIDKGDGIKEYPIHMGEMSGAFLISNNTQAIVKKYPDTKVQDDWEPATQQDWDNYLKLATQPNDFDTVKNTKKSQLRLACETACSSFTSNATGTMLTYLSDEKSMTYLSAEYQFVTGPNYDNQPTNIETVEKGFILHTGEQIVQVFLDGRKYIRDQNNIKLPDLLNKVDQCTTIDEVNNIVW